MKLLRLAIVALTSVSAACSDLIASPDRPMNNVEVFDSVWLDMNTHYSMFALKGVNWDSVRTALRPLAEQATTEADIARVVGQMLMSVRDRHVTLDAGETGLEFNFRTARDSQQTPVDEGLISRKYLVGGLHSSGDHVQFGRVSPTVGYIRIRSFNDTKWAGEVDAAIDSLSGVKSMIVDVRSNYGGTYSLAIDIAGRFADRERTFGYTRLRNGPGRNDFSDMSEERVRPSGHRFSGNVYVLTNRKVYSSGENFVLAMRSMPNVTVVGDTTGGSTGKPIERNMPNGWTFFVSSWIEYTLNKTPFEDVGLAPSVYVPSTIQDIIRGSDPVLDRAVELAK